MALASARVPSYLEPPGILRADGNRPDGASVTPWKRGQILVWDATYPDTFAPSHVALAAREACAVAFNEYSHLRTAHYVSPFAVETSGAFGPEVLSLVSDISWLIWA